MCPPSPPDTSAAAPVAGEQASSSDAAAAHARDPFVLMGRNEAAHCFDGWYPIEQTAGRPVRWAAEQALVVLRASESSTHAGIELWAPRSLRALRVTWRIVVRDRCVGKLPESGLSLDAAFRIRPGRWHMLEFPLARPIEAGSEVEVILENKPLGLRWPARRRRDAAVHRIWLRGDRARPSDVTIVVLNWNRPEETIACLESLRRADLGGAEVLVVDNGSRDGSVETIRARFPLQPILALPENRGYAGGNNAGVRAALDRGAKAVLLLNNDTQVAPDFLSGLLWAFNSHIAVAAVAAAVLRMDSPDLLDVAYLEIYFGHGIVRRRGVNALPGEGFAERREVDVGVGCCLLLSADALRQIGLLDEEYFAYHEEVDWCFRARAAHWQVLYEPYARIWHGGSKSTGALRGALPAERTTANPTQLPSVVPLSWNPVRSYLGARNAVRFVRAHATVAQKLYFIGSTAYAVPLELLAVLLRREEELALGLWTYRRALALYCDRPRSATERGIPRRWFGRIVRLPAVLLRTLPRDVRRAHREGRTGQLEEHCRGLWDGLLNRPLPLARLGLR